MPKKKTKQCKTAYCRRPAKSGTLCYRCEHERKKKNNPYRYWYGVNRRNARRRAKKYNNGKFWYVTFEYWVKFCDDTGYLTLKGRDKYAASIDCIENDLGYVDGNIRLLTVSDNAKKGTKKVFWNWITKTWELIVINPAFIDEPLDLPF